MATLWTVHSHLSLFTAVLPAAAWGNWHPWRAGSRRHAWQTRKMEGPSREGHYGALHHHPSLKAGLSWDTVPFGLGQFQSGFLLLATVAP